MNFLLVFFCVDVPVVLLTVLDLVRVVCVVFDPVRVD